MASLPLGVLGLIFCVMTVITLVMQSIGSEVNKYDPISWYGATPSYTTSGKDLRSTPASPSHITQTTDTNDPARAAPYIKICDRSHEGRYHQLHICGYNFTPREMVALIIESSGANPRSRSPVRADAQGMIEDVVAFPDCNSVPIAIVALNTIRQTEMSQVLERISPGDCTTQAEASIYRPRP